MTWRGKLGARAEQLRAWAHARTAPPPAVRETEREAIPSANDPATELGPALCARAVQGPTWDVLAWAAAVRAAGGRVWARGPRAVAVAPPAVLGALAGAWPALRPLETDAPAWRAGQMRRRWGVP